MRVVVERQVAGRSCDHGQHVGAKPVARDDCRVVHRDQRRGPYERVDSYVFRIDGDPQDLDARPCDVHGVREIWSRRKRIDNDLHK